ncbi:uncharacterized protein TEOVI_000900000 [Trypanosoma equiperdum]|uniref:Uncharacterized protein n=1 Tax=Trypanosoma equiperdum TaxID=5694 RepID=A0A1G4HZZ3_TRYEQ|nr:hypothetical protein, conserved [Trypanosoma equiperdum]
MPHRSTVSKKRSNSVSRPTAAQKCAAQPRPTATASEGRFPIYGRKPAVTEPHQPQAIWNNTSTREDVGGRALYDKELANIAQRLHEELCSFRQRTQRARMRECLAYSRLRQILTTRLSVRNIVEEQSEGR